MEKVSYGKIKQLLDGMVSVEVTAADGKNLELNGKYVLHFGDGKLDTTFSSITVDGYTATCEKMTENFASFEKLCEGLEKIGAADGKAMFLVKCGNFGSVAEYEAQGQFDALDMAGILDFYPEADEFELVDPYPAHVKLADEEAEKLQQECRRSAKLEAERLYDRLGPDAKAALPEFEELWREIGEETKAFFKKVKYKKLKKGASPFICDHVGEDTKYGEPAEFFWHAYHGYEMAEHQCEQAEALKLADGKDVLLEDAKFEPLKPHLISSRYTFEWHCTSGPLAKLYRFKLNERTKKWLRQYKSDYDLEELQDLALYKGDEILFSSCTHEVFHSDLRKK